MHNPSTTSKKAPPTLRRQFSWTLPANAIYGACSFLLLMTLNRWSGSDEAGTVAAGRFNWAMAATAPLFMFANLRFRTILATDTQSKNTLADFFRVRTLLVGIVGAFVAVMVGSLWREGESVKALLVLAIALVKAVEAFSDLCCGLQQRVERMDRIAMSLMANGLLMMGSFVLIYAQSGDVIYATLGLLAARLIVLLAYDIPMARIAARHECFRPSESIDQRRSHRMRMLMFAALPLGVTAGLLSLTSNIPKYVIPRVFDDSMLGVYGSLAVTIQAGNLIFRAIELPAMPRLAILLNTNNARGFWVLLGKLVSVFVVIALAGCVVSLLLGGVILTRVFGNAAYQTMGPVLALVVLGTAVAQIAGIIESSLIAARLTAIQLPMHCITVIGCFVLSLILIPKLEIYGAVLAVTICRFPFMLIGVWLLRQKIAGAGGTKTPTGGERKSPSTAARRAA